MNLNFLKEWRLIIMTILLILAIVSIDLLPKSGVVVISVNSNSSLYNKVSPGEYITWANEKEINSPEELYQFNDFSGSFRFIHSGKLEIVQADGTGLDIVVSKPSPTNLNFGLDIVGGTRVLLEPREKNVSDDIMQQIVNTLETRINIFGLKEAKIQQINDVTGAKYVQIEMAGGSKQEVEELLSKQGKFVAKIPVVIKFEDDISSLELENKYTIQQSEEKIVINSVFLEENDTAKIEDLSFDVINLTNDSVILLFSVINGTDIQSVCLQDQAGICVSRIMQIEGGWEFNFQVFITEEAAEKFAKVTNNLDVITDPTSGQSFLESRIAFYLDENLITDLNIGKDLKGKPHTSPVISGARQTRMEAFKEQLMIKSILQSGSLPVSLNIIRVDEISPVLGADFVNAAVLAALIATIAVAIVIFVRYRNPKILLVMMFWTLAEMVLTLGAASVIKWTIDLSSIAGLIAAIGTGTNDQVIVIDEILLGGSDKGTYTTKQRIKRAFFIVFGAAGTIIASMLPLMFIGVGVMKGFAIVTTIGVLIGVFVTRPAFGKVAEKILEK